LDMANYFRRLPENMYKPLNKEEYNQPVLPNTMAVMKGTAGDVIDSVKQGKYAQAYGQAARGTWAGLTGLGVDAYNTVGGVTAPAINAAQTAFTGKTDLPVRDYGGLGLGGKTGIGSGRDPATNQPVVPAAPSTPPADVLNPTATPPTAPTGLPQGWTKTVENGQITYADGRGNFLSGQSSKTPEENLAIVQRLAKSYGDTGQGIPSVNGPARPQGRYGDKQAQYDAQVKRAQNMRGAVPKTTSWNEAFKDYASGNVGSTGYTMVRNLKQKTEKRENGRRVPDLAGLRAFKEAAGLAKQEVANEGRGQVNSGGDNLKANRFLLDQQKFAYQQNQDAQDRAFAQQQAQMEAEQKNRELKKEESIYMDERSKSFRDNFMLENAPEGTPTQDLAAHAMAIAKESGLQPEMVKVLMQEELNKANAQDSWVPNFIEGQPVDWENKLPAFIQKVRARIQQ